MSEDLRTKWAVLDGEYWQGKGEISLYFGTPDGEHIEDIEWPDHFPKFVTVDFLKAEGFRVECA